MEGRPPVSAASSGVARQPVLGYLLRRLLIVPFMVALAAFLLALLPVVAACEAVTVLGLVAGRRPRWRVLRLTAFAAVYAVAECGCLLACLLLWLASPVPRRRDEDRWRARHARILDRFLATLMRAAELTIVLRLRLESPHSEKITTERSLIVLGRHAGPGASLVLVHVLLRGGEWLPRFVLKAKLRLDPAADVLATRLGCVFVGRAGGAADAVARLAGDLSAREALVLFPEGGDWTPARHRLAILRLRRKGLTAQAIAAAKMPHVLPPRPAGTFAALRAAPTAQIAVFMHTGHDDLLGVSSVWRALPLRRELHMVWWNEPRPEVATEEDCARWLNGVWQGIDDWIGEQAAMAELES